MKHENIIPGSKYIGTDLGNTGLDVLGEKIDNDTFPTPVIDALVTNEENAQVSRNRREGRSNKTHVRKALAAATSVIALAGGAYAVGKAAPDEKPRTPDKIELHNQHGILGSREIISGENATPAQVYAEQVRENGGQLPEAP